MCKLSKNNLPRVQFTKKIAGKVYQIYDDIKNDTQKKFKCEKVLSLLCIQLDITVPLQFIIPIHHNKKVLAHFLYVSSYMLEY